MLDKNKEMIWSWSFTKKLLVGMSVLALIVYLWCLLVMTFAPNISVYENVINALIEQTTKVYLVGVVGYLVKSSVENVFKHNDILQKEKMTLKKMI